jgi:L-aminopeptidase/D-esterase-like protein
MAANPGGSVVNPATGRLWEIGLELENEFGELGRRCVNLPTMPPGAPVRNTTIGVVATDAALTRVQALKVAQMAHDGLARAIRPAHTMFDGDTIFCLATGRRRLPETAGFFTAPHAPSINEIGHAAADGTARAIMHAVLSATTLNGLTAFRDLPPA